MMSQICVVMWVGRKWKRSICVVHAINYLAAGHM